MRKINKKIAAVAASGTMLSVVVATTAQQCTQDSSTTSVISDTNSIIRQALANLNNVSGTAPTNLDELVFYNAFLNVIGVNSTIQSITISDPFNSILLGENGSIAYIRSGAVEIHATPFGGVPTLYSNNSYGALEIDNITVFNNSIISVGAIRGLEPTDISDLPTYNGAPAAFYTNRGSGTNTERLDFTADVAYPVYDNLNNLGEDTVLPTTDISRPIVGGYVGVDRTNSTQYRWVDAAKNSSLTELVLAFNTQSLQTQTPSLFDASLNNATRMQNEGESVGNPYYNQIQAVHAYGKNITLGFGGYLNPGLHNVWNVAPGPAELARLLEDNILAYGAHTVDFDIEGDDTTTDSFRRLAIALGIVRNDLQQRLAYKLNIRFTLLEGSLTSEMDNALNDNGITDYIVNYMYNSFSTASEITGVLTRNIEQITNNISNFPTFNGLTLNAPSPSDSTNIYRRMGATFGSASTTLNPRQLNSLTRTATAQGWNYIGVWQLLDDHPANSVLEPNTNYQWPSDTYEFETSVVTQENFELKPSALSFTGAPDSNFSSQTPIDYYSTQTEFVFNWDVVDNASGYEIYYQPEPTQPTNLVKVGSTVTTTAVINPYTVARANTGGGNFLNYDATTGTYIPDGVSSASFNFVIRAVNNNSTDGDAASFVDSSVYTVDVNDTMIERPLYSYNGGVEYGMPDVGRYVYYFNSDNGDSGIYEIAAPVAAGVYPPNDTSSYTFIENNILTDGYSERAVEDLRAGIITRHRDVNEAVISYNPGEVITNDDLPNINNFLYERYLSNS